MPAELPFKNTIIHLSNLKQNIKKPSNDISMYREFDLQVRTAVEKDQKNNTFLQVLSEESISLIRDALDLNTDNEHLYDLYFIITTSMIPSKVDIIPRNCDLTSADLGKHTKFMVENETVPILATIDTSDPAFKNKYKENTFLLVNFSSDNTTGHYARPVKIDNLNVLNNFSIDIVDENLQLASFQTKTSLQFLISKFAGQQRLQGNV